MKEPKHYWIIESKYPNDGWKMVGATCYPQKRMAILAASNHLVISMEKLKKLYNIPIRLVKLIPIRSISIVNPTQRSHNAEAQTYRGNLPQTSPQRGKRKNRNARK